MKNEVVPKFLSNGWIYMSMFDDIFIQPMTDIDLKVHRSIHVDFKNILCFHI